MHEKKDPLTKLTSQLISLGYIKSFSKMTPLERELMTIIFSSEEELTNKQGDMIVINRDAFNQHPNFKENDFKPIRNSPFKLITSRIIEENIKTSTYFYPWFTAIQILPKTIAFKCSDRVDDLFSKLQSFLSFPAKELINIKTQSALRLYEILMKSGVFEGKPFGIDFDNLKTLMLEDPNLYAKAYFFNQSAIAPGLKLINEVVERPVQMSRQILEKTGCHDWFLFNLEMDQVDESDNDSTEIIIDNQPTITDDYFYNYVEAILRSGKSTHNIIYTADDVKIISMAYQSNMDLFSSNYYEILTSNNYEDMIDLLLSNSKNPILNK